jgi:hypothetical protein
VRKSLREMSEEEPERALRERERQTLREGKKYKKMKGERE